MTQKEKILAKFANHLKELREERGLSIRELALRSNLEYSQVQRIEKGKVNIALTTLLALADGLDIVSTELINYT
ncbi:anaerobic benzoate catabolism transcriptional regulator [mine drainage metagenome]|uniref:Anaerobic benzoate catabolism transcriptional regulator n=1 Tax=mine drainage metagenome TaxID=410659 RepID=A0A1J5NV26_9ZZZZ